ncbi:MAG: efflux RND transporter periplasmic adaptor subunit [Alphaproteobacteria bacterium]|nr:efflux RND transporter periplasmic adaptor subunit [Alphaproteobacteria bacterium]
MTSLKWQLKRRIVPALAVCSVLAALAPAVVIAETVLTVSPVMVEDMKAVFATVETSDVISARARIGGTVTKLEVDEGTAVKQGRTIALIGDPKIGFRMDALRSRIGSMQSQKDLAASTLKRARDLRRSGTIPQKRLDEAEAGFRVAERELKALQSEFSVVSRQQDEGAVLAPSAGRVTKVHVTKGAVILPGEPVATIAAKGYILRLSLPERHARFIKTGDAVQVGGEDANDGTRPRTGNVHQVYPEIRKGRVIADVTVEGLGDFFVGERVRVQISVGKRETFVVPGDYLFLRYGLTFATLKGGAQIVVQPGLKRPDGVEILSGLRSGDELILPVGQ